MNTRVDPFEKGLKLCTGPLGLPSKRGRLVKGLSRARSSDVIDDFLFEFCSLCRAREGDPVCRITVGTKASCNLVPENPKPKAFRVQSCKLAGLNCKNGNPHS